MDHVPERKHAFAYNTGVESGVPLVSYVVVNWHTEELLPRALESIAAQLGVFREVLLVDNGSPGFDETGLPEVENLTLISNSRNLGFAAANNQALSLATGDIIVLLNADACLEPYFSQRAAWILAANPSIGTVVPKILIDDHSGRIDSTGHVMHLDRTPAQRGRGELDQGQYDAGGFVFGGTAAAIAYRREMLEATAHTVGEGGLLGEVFDGAFFAYYEDVDLDWRAQRAGWQAYYEPRCVAYHRGHGSGGRRRLSIRLKAEKNRYLMLVKNDSLASQCASWWPLLLYEGWHGLKTLLQPWLWPAYLMLLANLPRALSYRWRTAPKHPVSAGEVARRFVPRGDRLPPRAEPPQAKVWQSTPEELASMQAETPPRFPLVSVVVLNLNGLDLTKRCLRALDQQSYPELEVIVVDNGSATDEARLLGIEFPKVRTLRLERNLGFSGGVNWGVSLARGEYIVLANNDTVPHEDCVRNLVYAAKRHGAAAVSGRLIDLADSELLAHATELLAIELDPDHEVAGGIEPALWDAFEDSRLNHALSLYGYVVPGGWGEEPGCFYPSGGLCALTREAAEHWLPELLPQRYFAYYEDVSLGFRLRSRGLKIIKEPNAAAVHVASSTARHMGRARLRFWQERNRRLTLTGWMPGKVLHALAPIRFAAWLGACWSLFFKSPQDWLGWCAAQWWLITHPVEVQRWRRQCLTDATVDPAAWLGELSGNVRWEGGWLNRWSLNVVRRRRIPHREQAPD